MKLHSVVWHGTNDDIDVIPRGTPYGQNGKQARRLEEFVKELDKIADALQR